MDPDLSNTLNLLPLQYANNVPLNDTVWGLPSWACWLIIAILLLISGMFSACENAFSNCNKYHFKAKANKGSTTAKIITKLIDKFDNTLVTVLVGNNIVQTLMSYLSALLFYNICKNAGMSDGIESILSTVVMAGLVYVVSDTVPKIVSKNIPNKMAYVLAWPVYILGYILYPVIFIFRSILALVHKLMKVKDESLLSKEDLLYSVSVAVNEDEENDDENENKDAEKLFENDEKEIVSNVLSFDKQTVNSVYTPLEKVFEISNDDLIVDKLNKIIPNTNFSRIPIYEDNKTNIIGVLVLRTYFQEYVKDKHLDVRSILEQPIFVDINDNLDSVFKKLNAEKVHLGVVKSNDKVVGIITMEDILEELVDDIDEKPASKLTRRKA